MSSPLRHLIKKEFRQIFRDRAMLPMIFALPLVQMFIFAYAVTTDLKYVRLAVCDFDRTPESRRLLDSFFASDYFQPAGGAESPEALSTILLAGDADMTITIPNGYARDLAEGTTAELGLVVDGQNSSMAGRARGYAEAIIRTEVYRIMDEQRRAHPELESRIHRIVPVTRFFYNPQLESRYYMVPGIIVMILTAISGMLTGMAVVREKEVGTLEQLLVTPLTSTQLIAGKTIPFLILAFFELTLTTVIAKFWFQLPLVGPIWILAFASFVYLMVTLGTGLLASTVSHTQQQAMFTVWFVLVFGILTSGFFYPVDNMPREVFLLTYLNPLRHYLEIIRTIFLRGVTLADIQYQLYWLAGLGTLVFGTAILRFQKRVR